MKVFSSAKLDATSKKITLFIFVIFTLLIFAGFLSYQINLFIIPILVSVVLISYFFMPQSYSVDNECITINFIFFKKKIQRNKVVEIKNIPKDELKNSIRTFAIGGLFGYNGKFYNSKLGNMVWFVTNTQKMVIIQLSDKKYIISPEEKDYFLNFLKTS